MIPDKLTRIAAPAVIVLAIVFAYLPSLDGDFIWDDDQHLVEDPFLEAPDGLCRIWFAPERYVWNYWPITRSSFWLERRIWGLNPLGYRLVNLALHSAFALLLWKVLQALKIPGAWVAALFFALHPVNVESVAWITQRKNTLSIVFYLLSIRWYLAFDREEGRGFYLASLAAFLLALLSKSAVVTLPVALLALALWKGRPPLKAALRRLAPYFGLALAAGLVSIWFERNFIGSSGPEFRLPLAERLVLAGRVFWFYLGKALWPDPVIFVYPRWELDPSAIASWLPLLGLAAIPVLFLLTRRRPAGGIFFALTYFAVSLFPVLGIFNIYFMRYSFVADHWQYLALPGAAALVAALGARGWKTLECRLRGPSRRFLRGAAALSVAALALLLASLTRDYCRSYRGLEPLWRDTIAKNPGAWMARINLGILLNSKEEFAEAITHFDRAVELYPDDPQTTALRSRGIAYTGLKDYDRALRDFNRALAVNPVNPDVYHHRGNLYRERNDLAAALRDWERAIAINPGFTDAYVNRGVARYIRGEVEPARADFSRAVELNPESEPGHYNLAIVLEELGEDEAALESFTRAIGINPKKAEAYSRRARIYDRLGLTEAAEADRRMVLRLREGTVGR